MPRHTRNTRGQTTADAFPLAAVVLFLSGCASEAYLLLIRRYLLNGTYRQMTVFLYALPILGWIGAALAAFGALWLVSAIRQKRGKLHVVLLAGPHAAACSGQYRKRSGFCQTEPRPRTLRVLSDSGECATMGASHRNSA